MPAAAHLSAALSLTLLALTFTPALECRIQAGSTAPDAPETDRLLALMHDYAAHYVSALPDFICLQTTDQFQAGKKGDHWKQLDSLTSKLVFANGEEHRTLQLVNGRKPDRFRVARRPLTSEGEFAILISNIFGESSQATFEWQGWQSFHGQRCAVVRYRITQEHSTMKLRLSDLASATVSYEGLVVADPANGSIRRVTSEANEIPPEVQTRSIATIIDYSPVTVGNASYLLPSDASVEIATPSGRVRNELHFRNYQKFEADSTIKFDSDSTQENKTPPPQ